MGILIRPTTGLGALRERRTARSRWLLTASAGACLLAAGAAQAAETAADADAAAPSAVSEVVVEARQSAIDLPPVADKTGTAIQDLPGSVQVIPREVLIEQGAVMLRDSLANASGVNVGGQDTKGFYDHFLIRGLNAQVFEDGFSDGDQLGGLSHSLNGVERIEVVEGPGSALFGSGPPGGTINIVHSAPSADFHFGASLQGGSFGTVVNSDYVTGAAGAAGLNYRIDATFARADGFRSLKSEDEEVRPALEWRVGGHTIDFALDLRHIEEVPDSYGIIYFDGSPLKGVSLDAKYSTPFDFAHTDFARPTLTDSWKVSDVLTVNNRLSYLYRTLDSLGNGDSTSTKVSVGEVIGRQARQQSDTDNDLDYQVEPVWRFSTGSVRHTLLTGFEYQHQALDTQRTTADLPNIPDALAPVPPETSIAGLTFLCDAKHSCDDDRLRADYYGLYVTDQIDITDRLKVRAGVRQDWFDTALTPLISVPGRFGADGKPLLAGVTDAHHDAPVSWNAGALYKIAPWASPYVGVSQSHLVNFNSENTQNGVGAPESALQYEGGIKFAFLHDRVVLNTAVFSVSRDNVAAATTVNGLETVVFDSQRTRGEEASLDALITQNWRLLANLTFQDAVITDNPQGITSVGRHPQGAPASLANLWTSYDFAIGGVAGFRVGGGINYQSKTYSDITNVNAIPASTIVNAMVGYETPRWGLDVNVRNLTNQRYFIAANAAGALVGEPVSALVTLHANF
ncbi:TonB-dependent siderophore receptor [Phenylobacterium sp.]|uniref:TonB-dependent receptor n=1 Tax=Phenylobacterium sp. TaxID=1871053 RepID=UPI001205F058|nr:TonB-dependent receptor [Phenylobacterium sp.]THD64793.1 MAG: TonB-dependent receptor [Phenylobacterium sp.]